MAGARWIGLVCLAGILLMGCEITKNKSTPTGIVTITSTVQFVNSPTQPVITTVTLTPSATRTPLPTQQPITTPYPTQTKQLFATSTPTFILPLLSNRPSAGPQHYRLKEWTEVDMQAAISGAETIIENNDWFNWNSPYYMDYFIDYSITLEREAVLRFPNATNPSKIAWGLARYEIIQRGRLRSPSQYNFRSLLLDALNTGQTVPDQMVKWLAERGFKVVKMLPVDNLTGDGSPAWVLQVNLPEATWDPEAVFTLTYSSTGEYRLDQVYPMDTFTWPSFFHGAIEVEVADHTGNGLPEIVVMTYWWGSGISTLEFYNIYIFEWQKSTKNFTNLAANLPTLKLDEFEQFIDYSNPYPWVFGPSDAIGAEPITAPSNEFFMSYNNQCPPPIYQIIYNWNGLQYQWAGEGYVPYDTTTQRICQVGWTMKSGEWNDKAIPGLEDALHNWSENYEWEWGPAAKDYLRLRLGILYALRGQHQQAVLALTTVRDHPEHPEFSMPSQIARTFLSNYRSPETVRACIKTIDFLNNALNEPDFHGWNFYQILPVIVKEKWGIADPLWIYDGSATCDLQTSFRQSLNTANPLNTRQLVEWFNRSSLDWGPLVRADIDGNGVEDWLVALRTGKYRNWEIWMLLRDGQTIRPVWIAYYSDENQGLTLKLLYPESQEQPISLLRTGNDIYLFEIRNALENLKLIPVVPEKSTNLLQNYSILTVDNYEVSIDGKTITLLDNTYSGFYSPGDIKQAVYQWNPNAHSYILTEALISPQDQVILRAEKSLFEDKQPQDVIDKLQELLAGEIIEPVTTWSSEEGYGRRPPRIRPYVQYLLALAYELSGEEGNAVQAYWQIWNNYPDNPYALAARAKLQLITP